MGKTFLLGIFALYVICHTISCSSDKPPVAPAVKMRDSSAVMTTYGVSKLISDSGVIRYKIVAEEWRVFDRTTPTKQTFPKGLLLEKFNPKFHVEMYITADTAYWYNQSLWELRGRVSVWNDQSTTFNSEILYWDMNKHEFYSNVYSHLVTPDRDVEGNSFHSNEQMTVYEVNFSHAVFPLPGDLESGTAQDSTETDTTLTPQKEEKGKTSLPTPKRKEIKISDKRQSPNPHFVL